MLHQNDFPHDEDLCFISHVSSSSHCDEFNPETQKVFRGTRSNHCKIAQTLTMKYDSPFPKVNLSFVWCCTRQSNFVYLLDILRKLSQHHHQNKKP